MTNAVCEAIEAEFFPCGEPATHTTERDGRSLCGEHAAQAARADEVVIGPSGHAARYDHINAELFEVSL